MVLIFRVLALTLVCVLHSCIMFVIFNIILLFEVFVFLYDVFVYVFGHPNRIGAYSRARGKYCRWLKPVYSHGIFNAGLRQ